MDVVNREQRNGPAILRPANGSAHVQLTAREKEVLAWAARGKTVADTAQILGISPETVEGFVKQALRKLDAANKTHGVAKSIALGLIDL
jgi:LuxR family quorum sensing-dependent transcriptional regulator